MSKGKYGNDAKAQIRDALAHSTSEAIERMRQARTELVLGVYSNMDQDEQYEQRRKLQAWLIAAYVNLLPFRSSVNQWEEYTLWETEGGKPVPVDYIELMFTEREQVTEPGDSLSMGEQDIQVPKVYPWEHLVAGSRTLDELASDAIMNRRPAYHAGDTPKYDDDGNKNEQ